MVEEQSGDRPFDAIAETLDDQTIEVFELLGNETRLEIIVADNPYSMDYINVLGLWKFPPDFPAESCDRGSFGVELLRVFHLPEVSSPRTTDIHSFRENNVYLQNLTR
jgi:hypothetical protein